MTTPGRAAALRPRTLALIALFAGVGGFLFATVPAISGPGGLSVGYMALYWVIAVLIVDVVLIVLGAVVALARRTWGIALMLGATVFVVEYVVGYLVSQQLGIYY